MSEPANLSKISKSFTISEIPSVVGFSEVKLKEAAFDITHRNYDEDKDTIYSIKLDVYLEPKYNSS